LVLFYIIALWLNKNKFSAKKHETDENNVHT
jgi:hypothetical protein